MKFNNYKTKAFTMIELLVVIAIVGILSALITPAVQSMMQDGRDTERKAELNTLRKAIWMQSNMGSLGYPIETSWCCVDEAGDCPNLASALVPTYISKLPSDPMYNLNNKEFCYMYKSNGITFDLYAKLEKKGSVSLSPDQVKISETQTCDEANGWIDTGLGFCVMQWEARNSGGYPASISTGTPWVSITQPQAAAACKSIGAHLINNAEWMALARDIESVGSNYVSGVLKRGNVGDSATGDYDGANPESGVTNSLGTLSLSNGKTINHLSGNVWEWVDYTITGANSQPQTPNLTAFAWGEINSITNWGNTLSYGMVGPKNTSLDGSKGAGRIYYQSTYTSEIALLRGGSWDDTLAAGVFALALNRSPSSTNTYFGFRCAR